MSQSEAAGCFVWHDLMTTDPEAAQEFYRPVAAWGITHWAGGSEPYPMWTIDETPIGGVMPIPGQAAASGTDPHWLPYLSVEDVDECVRRAKELEGEVLITPRRISDLGRVAVLRDPQGALFAILDSEDGIAECDPAPGPGHFSWHELATTDQEAAFEFYRRLFGWEKGEATDMGEMGLYQIFVYQGHPRGGIYNRSPELPGGPAWLCYVMVEDVHAAAERVKERGGEVLNGPMGVPGGDWIAQCADPQGAPFALHTHPHPRE